MEAFLPPHETGDRVTAGRPTPGDTLQRLVHIYETILSNTDDFAYIFDPQGRFLYANTPLLKVWAKSLDEVIGKTCLQLGYPDWHAAMHMREIESIVRDKTPVRGEVPFTGDSGISGVYDYIFKPVLDAAGNVEIIVGTTRDVTDRKRGEEKLKEAKLELQKRAEELERVLREKSQSEQRYRFLSDTVPQIVWTAKPDGNLDYYNQRWFDYAQTNLEQMQELGWLSFVHPEDQPIAVKAWQEAVMNESNYEVEFRIRRASDGSYRWHLVRAFPMRDENGRVIQWAGTCTDTDDLRQLSERRRITEEELIKTNQQLQNVLGSITDGLAILDKNWCYTFYSQQAAALTLVPAQESIIGKCIWDVFPQTKGTKFYSENHRAVETGKPVHFEEFYPAPINKWFECHAYPSIEGLSVYFHDITERKRAEQALLESEAKLRLYFNSSIIGNIMADITGKVFEANDEYLRIIGYSREELVSGKVAWDRITPEEFLQRDFEAIEIAKKTGFSGPYEKQYIRRDGTRIWVIVGFVMYEEIKTIAFILDISGRKLAETALHEAQIKLEAHSQQLEATVQSRTAKLFETIAELEHFSYAIVHDLRAPLRAMEGYAHMMEEDLASGDLTLTKEYARRIKIASRRMDNLIRDSLNYSQANQQELALVPINLSHLIDELTETYPNLRSKDVLITMEQPLPTVLGNESALTQCFSNLLGNAIKFAKAGEKPQIRIRAQELLASENATKAGFSKFTRIWVEDNGIGIPPEAQERIFGLFQRASMEREGNGLGLAIVRKVVERMGGRVGVESEPGLGSKFWIDLPLA